MLPPFNLQKWVKNNTDKFTPPIGNHQLYKEQWEKPFNNGYWWRKLST